MRINTPTLMHPNFRGVAQPYNAWGQRNFALVLDRDTAREMEKLGWKVNNGHNEDKEPVQFVRVHIPSMLHIDGRVAAGIDLREIPLHGISIAAMPYNLGDRTGFKLWLVDMHITMPLSSL